MKTVFVYSSQETFERNALESYFEGTRVFYEDSHLVVFPVTADDLQEDLQEFHEQVRDWADTKISEVYFYDMPQSKIRTIIESLLAMNASVVFKLTPMQRKLVGA